MTEQSSASASTSGLLPVGLFLVFVLLKLSGDIGWSWWWVTAPLWIPATGWLLVLAVLGIAVLVKTRRGHR